MTDYYELLGVGRNASDDEIKRAYRRLARQLHPDANAGDPSAEARFKEVSTAYEVLRDPERRQRYDLLGPDGARAGSGAGAGGFGPGLGDLFGAFFGQGSPFGHMGGSPSGAAGAATRRGADVETVLEIDFAEAVFGVAREVSVRVQVSCDTCEGTGAQPGSSPSTCAECRGAGQVRRVRQSILGQIVTAVPCDRCRGTGEVIASPCPVCRGEGRHTADRSVPIEIPPGVDDGTTLRVSGAGAAALRGGVPGDLYVHLKVRADPRFERSGADLLTEVHIGMTQAALGAEVELQTLEGTEPLSVAAGTQSGKIVHLRGRGVPELRGRGRGDLLVRIVVDVPTKLSKQEEELLRQLAALRGEAVGTSEGGLLSRLRSALG